MMMPAGYGATKACPQEWERKKDVLERSTLTLSNFRNVIYFRNDARTLHHNYHVVTSKGQKGLVLVLGRTRPTPYPLYDRREDDPQTPTSNNAATPTLPVSASRPCQPSLHNLSWSRSPRSRITAVVNVRRWQTDTDASKRGLPSKHDGAPPCRWNIFQNGGYSTFFFLMFVYEEVWTWKKKRREKKQRGGGTVAHAQ